MKSQQILTVSPQCHNMVKIHIGEQQTRALCNSGAQITCISEHFFNSTNVHASAKQKNLRCEHRGSWGVNAQSERSNSPTHSVSEYRHYTEHFCNTGTKTFRYLRHGFLYQP